MLLNADYSTFFFHFIDCYKTLDECTSSDNSFMDHLGLILAVHFPAARIAANVLTGYNLQQVQAQLMSRSRTDGLQKPTVNIDILLPQVWVFHIIFVFHDRKWVLSLGKEYLCDSAK